MLFYCFLIAGLFVLSMALRSFGHWLPIRLGNLCFLSTSYLLGWVLTGSHLGGAGCVFLWFLLPWVEIVTRTRKLEMPVTRSIESQAPPGPSRFPALDEITEEIELLGFHQVETTVDYTRGELDVAAITLREDTIEVRASTDDIDPAATTARDAGAGGSYEGE
jgi:hypothetical protein